MKYTTIFEKMAYILARPTQFFTNLKKEKDIVPSFLFFLVLMAWTLIMTVFSRYIFSSFISPEVSPLQVFPYSIIILLLFLGYAIGALFQFIVAGILHVYILLFGGKASYTKTFQVLIYSGTPSFLVGWIPIVNFFAWIWALVLLIQGTHLIHKISKLRSALMYVIPTVILFGVALGISLWYYLNYARMFVTPI